MYAYIHTYIHTYMYSYIHTYIPRPLVPFPTFFFRPEDAVPWPVPSAQGGPPHVYIYIYIYIYICICICSYSYNYNYNYIYMSNYIHTSLVVYT